MNRKEDMNRKNDAIKSLFDHWEEAMIWSCLQGHMGQIFADDQENPRAAMIDIGDFCFLAGEPSLPLLSTITGEKLLVPQSQAWEKLIESHYGSGVDKITRYAIKKEPHVFDVEKLTAYINSLEDCYELRMFDEEMFEMAGSEPWSVDLCSQFPSYEDYKNRATGAGILHQGKLVAGASPYAVYDKGIEIEIDTKPEFRRQGLATVCGAKLIVECLKKGIYPSWDAHDLRSVALAEKLGYHRGDPYVAYVTSEI